MPNRTRRPHRSESRPPPPREPILRSPPRPARPARCLAAPLLELCPPNPQIRRLARASPRVSPVYSLAALNDSKLNDPIRLSDRSTPQPVTNGLVPKKFRPKRRIQNALRRCAIRGGERPAERRPHSK